MCVRKLSYFYTSNRLLSWGYQQRPTNAPKQHSTCSLRNSVQQRKSCDVIFVLYCCSLDYRFAPLVSFLQFYNCFTSTLFPQKCFAAEFPETIFVMVHPGWVQTDMGNSQEWRRPYQHFPNQLCCPGLWIRIRPDLELVQIERFRDTFIPEPYPYVPLCWWRQRNTQLGQFYTQK